MVRHLDVEQTCSLLLHVGVNINFDISQRLYIVEKQCSGSEQDQFGREDAQRRQCFQRGLVLQKQFFCSFYKTFLRALCLWLSSIDPQGLGGLRSVVGRELCS